MLAGHVARHNEPAGKLMIWFPEESRRVGRPKTTIKMILEEDTGLKGKHLINAMLNRKIWKEDYVSSPPG